MEVQELVLERSFSKLGKLQRAHTIRYCCHCVPQGSEISLQEGHLTECHTLALDKERANLLVRFLYENAVPMETWRDVVEELLSRV